MGAIVKSEDELKIAVEKKIGEITIVGDLADKLHQANKKIDTAKGAGVLSIIAGIALIPFTAGSSAVFGFGAAAATAGTGVTAALVGIGLSVGIVGFIVAMNKNYTEIEYSIGILKLKLKK